MKKIIFALCLIILGCSRNNCSATGKVFLSKKTTQIAYNNLLKKPPIRFYTNKNDNNKSGDSCFDCCLIAAFCGFIASRIGQ
jgi:hypothetical protein